MFYGYSEGGGWTKRSYVQVVRNIISKLQREMETQGVGDASIAYPGGYFAYPGPGAPWRRSARLQISQSDFCEAPDHLSYAIIEDSLQCLLRFIEAWPVDSTRKVPATMFTIHNMTSESAITGEGSINNPPGQENATG